MAQELALVPVQLESEQALGFNERSKLQCLSNLCGLVMAIATLVEDGRILQLRKTVVHRREGPGQ